MFVEYLQNNEMINYHLKNHSLPITYEVLRDNTLAVRIYFEDTSYVYITENPKTVLVDLIATIGGILGLFLGISVSSYMEIIQIALDNLLICVLKQ
jgi:hypothetical protein